jgi:SpoIID/LytB domain protein
VRPRMLLALSIAVAMLLTSALPAAALDVDGSVRIEGRGFGHGVGMSQYGARSMAAQGHTASQILRFYYTGVDVGPWNTSGTLLVGLNHINGSRVWHTDTYSITNRSDSGDALTVHLGGSTSLAVPAGREAVVRYRPGTDGAATTDCSVTVSGTTRNARCSDVRVTWPVVDAAPRTFVQVRRGDGLHDLTLARGILAFAQPSNRAHGDLHLRLEIPMQDYLFGINEMPSSWPEAALQAQAITARTYAQRFRSSTLASCSCNIGTTTTHQHYTGWGKEGEAGWGSRWVSAVRATDRQVVSAGGGLVTTYYSSSSGGHTEYVADIWGGNDLPHLAGKPDPYSVDAHANNPLASWVRTPTYAAFAAALGMDSVSSARVTETNRSGSPRTIAFNGSAGGKDVTTTLSSQTVRTALGLPSHVIARFHLIQPAALEWFEGDFDGDGRTDVAAYNASTGDWIVGRSNGGGFELATWANFGTRTGWSRHVVGDFTGDGRDDIASYHEPSGRWWVNRSTGSSFTPELWASLGTRSGWTEQLVGDFTGDGRADIAAYHPSNGAWWVHASTSTRFRTTQWATFSTRTGWQTHLVGDVNGDGQDDLISYHPRRGSWWVSASTGSSFAGSSWGNYSPGDGWLHLVGDFTGDGRTDIASYYERKGFWWVGRSTGTTFLPERWAIFGTTSGWGEHLVGRFGHPSRDSIASFHVNGTWWVNDSDGDRFQTTRWARLGSASGWHDHLVGDIDGDGRDDLVGYHPSNRSLWGHVSTGGSFATSRWGTVR